MNMLCHCRLRQARDRDQLQALITELDQLAIEVDPDKMLKKSGVSDCLHVACHTA